MGQNSIQRDQMAISYLQYLVICPTKICLIALEIYSITKLTLKCFQTLVKFCPSGEISPNLVTLSQIMYIL